MTAHTETMTPASDRSGAAAEEYNYGHFHPKYLAEDARLAVRPKGVVPGEPAPDFELRDTEGRSWRLGELRGRPVVLITGSGTCPMTHGSVYALRDVHREFGVRRGGEVSTHDLWKGAPPMAANLWLGRHMRPLLAPLARRGRPIPTGAKLAGAALLAGILLGRRASRRRR